MRYVWTDCTYTRDQDTLAHGSRLHPSDALEFVDLISSSKSSARYDGQLLKRSGVHTSAECYLARAYKFSKHTVIVHCTGSYLKGGPSRSQRAGLPYVQDIDDGSHQPVSGVRGRVHSTSGDKLQHSSQPGGSNSFSPIIVRKQGASEHHEDYQQARWHLISPDGTQGSARLHGSDKRSRHQRLREQQYIY